MAIVARRCLIGVSIVWLGAACGGDEMAIAPSGGTAPSAAETSSSSTASGKSTTPTSTTSTGSSGSMTGAMASAAAAGSGAKAPASTPAGTAQMAAQTTSQVNGQASSQPATGAAGAPATGAAGASPSAGAAGAPAANGGATPAKPDGTPNLFWLEFNSSRVMQSKDMKTAMPVATTGVAPDGVAVDVAGGKIYWTNMGSALGTGGGTVQRANLDGSMVETIVPAGVGTTFKQTTLDLTNKKIYWGDREGKKLWRANLDGSMHEVFVTGHGLREVVGVAVDVAGGKVYFTDRTGGKILRAGLEMPAGATGESRMDVEDVLITPPGATPIDLEIDHSAKKLYWTDRMLGTVHVMGLEMPAGMSAKDRTDDKTIVMGLSETIGICLDVPNNKMYYTELGGAISSAALDGSGQQRGIIRSNGATGCALAYLPN